MLDLVHVSNPLEINLDHHLLVDNHRKEMHLLLAEGSDFLVKNHIEWMIGTICNLEIWVEVENLHLVRIVHQIWPSFLVDLNLEVLPNRWI
jgi:hypothetical protein